MAKCWRAQCRVQFFCFVVVCLWVPDVVVTASLIVNIPFVSIFGWQWENGSNKTARNDCIHELDPDWCAQMSSGRRDPEFPRIVNCPTTRSCYVDQKTWRDLVTFDPPSLERFPTFSPPPRRCIFIWMKDKRWVGRSFSNKSLRGAHLISIRPQTMLFLFYLSNGFDRIGRFFSMVSSSVGIVQRSISLDSL